MILEKQTDFIETSMTRSGCSGCSQNNATENQSKYGSQVQQQRNQTNKGSLSGCSC